MQQEDQTTKVEELSQTLTKRMQDKNPESGRIELRVRYWKGASSDLMKTTVGYGSASDEEIQEGLETILEQIEAWNKNAEKFDQKKISRIEEVFTVKITTQKGAFDMKESVRDL